MKNLLWWLMMAVIFVVTTVFVAFCYAIRKITWPVWYPVALLVKPWREKVERREDEERQERWRVERTIQAEAAKKIIEKYDLQLIYANDIGPHFKVRWSELLRIVRSLKPKEVITIYYPDYRPFPASEGVRILLDGKFSVESEVDLPHFLKELEREGLYCEQTGRLLKFTWPVTV